MGKTEMRIALGCVSALALSGCSNVLHKLGLRDNAVEVRPVGPAASPSGQSATEDGRRMLAAGQPGNAAEAFQRALASGEEIAPALNGLGVAYARLGRPDRAQRYFEQAVAVAPGDARFAENLARLTRSPAYAMAHKGDLAEQFRLAANADLPEGAVSGSAPMQGMDLRTAAPGNAPVARVEVAAVPEAFEPVVRVRLDDSDKPAADAKPAAPAVRKTVVVSARFKPEVRIPLPSSRSDTLQRVSRGEVRIVTASAAPEPQGARVAARDEALRGFRPVVRVRIGEGSPKAAAARSKPR